MIAALRQRGRTWHARVRLDSWTHPREISLKVSDKRVAEEKLRELVRRWERQEIGLLPSDAVLESTNRPILSLLADFLADLEVRGRAAATTRVYRVRLTALVRETGWQRLRDVTPGSFERWRRDRMAVGRGSNATGGSAARSGPQGGPKQDRVRALGVIARPTDSTVEGAAPKSVNDTLGGLRTFLRWCERRGFIDFDPMRHVEKVSVRGTRGYRRAVSADQLAALFAAVPERRAVVYRTAYYTGLRRKELSGLRRGDFTLDGVCPSVRVPGAVAKNGKTQEVPLHPALVAVLRVWWPADLPPFAWAFRGHVPKIGTWRRDIERAGIPFVDEDGRRFDFHALRHTLCTHLREARVGLRDAMAIMRHSDPRLTLRVYTDERQVSLSGEISKLPNMSVPRSVAALSGGV